MFSEKVPNMCDFDTHGAMGLDQNNWVFTNWGVHGQSKTRQPGRPFFRIDRSMAESSIRSFEDEKFQSCEAAFVEAMQLHLSTTTVQHEQRCKSSRCTGCEKAGFKKLVLRYNIVLLRRCRGLARHPPQP